MDTPFSKTLAGAASLEGPETPNSVDSTVSLLLLGATWALAAGHRLRELSATPRDFLHTCRISGHCMTVCPGASSGQRHSNWQHA